MKFQHEYKFHLTNGKEVVVTRELDLPYVPEHIEEEMAVEAAAQAFGAELVQSRSVDFASFTWVRNGEEMGGA